MEEQLAEKLEEEKWQKVEEAKKLNRYLLERQKLEAPEQLDIQLERPSWSTSQPLAGRKRKMKEETDDFIASFLLIFSYSSSVPPCGVAFGRPKKPGILVGMGRTTVVLVTRCSASAVSWRFFPWFTTSSSIGKLWRCSGVKLSTMISLLRLIGAPDRKGMMQFTFSMFQVPATYVVIQAFLYVFVGTFAVHHDGLWRPHQHTSASSMATPGELRVTGHGFSRSDPRINKKTWALRA